MAEAVRTEAVLLAQLATAQSTVLRLKSEINHVRQQQRQVKREEKKAANALAREARRANRVRQRRRQGLCIKCGKQAMDSQRGRMQFCETHRAKALKAQRKLRKVIKPRLVLEEQANDHQP